MTCPQHDDDICGDQTPCADCPRADLHAPVEGQGELFGGEECCIVGCHAPEAAWGACAQHFADAWTDEP